MPLRPRMTPILSSDGDTKSRPEDLISCYRCHPWARPEDLIHNKREILGSSRAAASENDSQLTMSSDGETKSRPEDLIHNKRGILGSSRAAASENDSQLTMSSDGEDPRI